MGGISLPTNDDYESRTTGEDTKDDRLSSYNADHELLGERQL